MGVMRLFLVRHGETVWHARNRYAGVSDISLSDEGRRQARALGSWAEKANLDAIYSSTLSRSKLTAEPAVLATRLNLRLDARLCEVDFGRCEGLTRSEIAGIFPVELQGFMERPASSAFPCAETGRDAIHRAMPAIRSIAEEHESGRVLVIMHSTLLRLLIAHLLGIDPDRYRTVFPEIGNCSINEIEFNPATPGNTKLIRFNA
jgi:probable phosphoglycerate mutase